VIVEPMPLRGGPLDAGADPDESADPSTRLLVTTILARISREMDAINFESAHGYTAHAVHESRVAIRRARADLRMLRPLLDPGLINECRAQLRPVGEQLAPIRHIDTMLNYLQRAIDDLPSCTQDATALAHALYDARDEAAIRARWAARGAAFESARSSLRAAASNPPLRLTKPDVRESAADLAVSLVGRPRRSVRLAFRRWQDDSEAGLDDLRIAARYLRYAAEAVVGAAPGAEVVAGAASLLHEALGDISEGALVRGYLENPPGGVNVAAGLRRVLLDIVDDDVSVAQRTWPHALEFALDAPIRPVQDVEPLVAGGGIVCREGATGLEVLLVHRPKYDDWSLPKGLARPGEPIEACALREVAEETGLQCRIVGEVGSVDYANRHGRPKRAVFFTMVPVGQAAQECGEVDATTWLPWREARGMVKRRRDRQLLTMLGTATRALSS
jgi:8-oxo-dGTP diphosphatase